MRLAVGTGKGDMVGYGVEKGFQTPFMNI